MSSENKPNMNPREKLTAATQSFLIVDSVYQLVTSEEVITEAYNLFINNPQIPPELDSFISLRQMAGLLSLACTAVSVYALSVELRED